MPKLKLTLTENVNDLLNEVRPKELLMDTKSFYLRQLLARDLKGAKLKTEDDKYIDEIKSVSISFDLMGLSKKEMELRAQQMGFLTASEYIRNLIHADLCLGGHYENSPLDALLTRKRGGLAKLCTTCRFAYWSEDDPDPPKTKSLLKNFPVDSLIREMQGRGYLVKGRR